MSGFSKACCTLPPVEADYTPKGTYTDLAGFKTYVVGPEDAQSAIIHIYDIFGFSPQILQGADLLASQGFRVVMPDFCKGDYATADMFGPSEESQKKKAAWFSGFPGAITSQTHSVATVTKALKSAGHGKIGVLGACWGYKVIVMSEGAEDLSAMAGVHPSFADPSDAERIKVPACLLPSSAEDMDVMNKLYAGIEAKHPGKNVMKHYPDQVHGFLAARADLKDPNVVKAYSEGYTVVAEFFKAHL